MTEGNELTQVRQNDNDSYIQSANTMLHTTKYITVLASISYSQGSSKNFQIFLTRSSSILAQDIYVNLHNAQSCSHFSSLGEIVKSNLVYNQYYTNIKANLLISIKANYLAGRPSHLMLGYTAVCKIYYQEAFFELDISRSSIIDFANLISLNKATEI